MVAKQHNKNTRLSLTFDLAIIDLDNTLYNANSGVFQRMDERMNRYIQTHVQLLESEANDLRLDYWQRYGTTLRGLMLHHGIDAEHFLHDVHDINAHELLTPDSLLEHALSHFPCRKVIHTNGTKEHAKRILHALNITDHFSKIYDIRFNHYQPKPCEVTLAMLLEKEKTEARRTLVVDDMPDNLSVARKLGMKTCWVHDDPDKSTNDWDYSVARFHDFLPL
ncbi:MAG: pyrimidine 5'-nucleotidase [Mariprofundaceae bacterium]|nr:pyrimidine 5'-nucleotidase [Mariprofundaceae bacterium]